MTRRIVTVFAVLAIAAGATIAGQKPQTTVEVYKSATCGCCAKWVEHLEAKGFTVKTTNVDDLDSVKAKHNIPQPVQSCHTALVNGYVVEGHVPVEDVQRLLEEKPKVAGIAVPGMPMGSPGMETPSGRVQPYDVLTFDKTGRTQVYASHK